VLARPLLWLLKRRLWQQRKIYHHHGHHHHHLPHNEAVDAVYRNTGTTVITATDNCIHGYAVVGKNLFLSFLILSFRVVVDNACLLPRNTEIQVRCDEIIYYIAIPILVSIENMLPVARL
jgi:hypothetical protein